jgi:hypothetical protein
MFTTDLIRLAYLASIRTQVHQESPSNRKWVLAKGPFVVGIDSISDGSSIAARDSNPKNVLGPIRTALREAAVALPLLGVNVPKHAQIGLAPGQDFVIPESPSFVLNKFQHVAPLCSIICW